MATQHDTREFKLVYRAIGFGLVMLKRIGEPHAVYRIESETDLSLEQAEDFIAMIERGSGTIPAGES